MITIVQKSMQQILIVDDKPSISELISTSLSFVGFDIPTAVNSGKVDVVSKPGAGTTFILFFSTVKG